MCHVIITLLGHCHATVTLVCHCVSWLPSHWCVTLQSRCWALCVTLQSGTELTGQLYSCISDTEVPGHLVYLRERGAGTVVQLYLRDRGTGTVVQLYLWYRGAGTFSVPQGERRWDSCTVVSEGQRYRDSCTVVSQGLGQWAEFSFCTGTGQPGPPQSPAALQVGWGKPKARVLTWHLSMGAWISLMKSPSAMHDPRGSESTCQGPSRFSTVVNSLERDGLLQAFLP